MMTMTTSPEHSGASSATATAVLGPTTASAEHEYARARAAGYAAGWSQGAQAAQEAIRREVDDHRARLTAGLEAERETLRAAAAALHEAAAQLRDVTAPAVEQHVDTVLSAALQLAEAVLTHEPLAARSPGRDAIRRAMTAAPEVHAIRIRLCPQDVAALQDTDLPDGLSVVADVGLQPGDSVLEHGAGSVEVLLQAALQRARAVLES
jgi:flagellar assembly protein FliH